MTWAGAYVGLPFGDGPGEVTCWSLVRRVYAERMGIDLPEYGEISASDLLAVAREMEAGQARAPWLPVTAPVDGDVCLMRSGQGGGRRVVHVGIMADARHVLHVEAASAAVVVPVTHFSVAGRILGYRRYGA